MTPDEIIYAPEVLDRENLEDHVARAEPNIFSALLEAILKKEKEK